MYWTLCMSGRVSGRRENRDRRLRDPGPPSAGGRAVATCCGSAPWAASQQVNGSAAGDRDHVTQCQAAISSRPEHPAVSPLPVAEYRRPRRSLRRRLPQVHRLWPPLEPAVSRTPRPGPKGNHRTDARTSAVAPIRRPSDTVDAHTKTPPAAPTGSVVSSKQVVVGRRVAPPRIRPRADRQCADFLAVGPAPFGVGRPV